MTKRKLPPAGLVAAGLLALVVLASVIAFQDSIFRFVMSPRTPFQITTPPTAPEYGARGAWLLWPEAPSKDVDVFYVHSTTYYRRRRWNAPINHDDADRIRRMIAAPNEAGPFVEVADIYGPRYREATVFSLFTHKYDGLAARKLAYDDVKRAFETFLDARDPEKPLMLVGYGQGGLHVLGLLNEYFQGRENPLRHRLAAAYVVGFPTPQEFLTLLDPAIPVCKSAEDVRCIVSYVDFEPRFDEEMARARRRSLIWEDTGELASAPGGDLICVNPLTWTQTTDYQPADKHVGAASATGVGFGARPPKIARAVGTKCDRGILVVDKPRQTYLRRSAWYGAKWKAQPFNLFYFDLEANAAARAAELIQRLKTDPEALAPIGDTVDLGVSPINKVRD
ncbi:MAG: DUF3089 domain-containing protein [Parvularculaceae bacterium]|nr:DUF3089 domain-containing protein [Parvularculaceae bacterium]